MRRSQYYFNTCTIPSPETVPRHGANGCEHRHNEAQDAYDDPRSHRSGHRRANPELAVLGLNVINFTLVNAAGRCTFVVAKVHRTVGVIAHVGLADLPIVTVHSSRFHPCIWLESGICNESV